MSRWPASLLRIAFAFVILLLATAISVAVGTLFRTQNNRISGTTFIATVAGLVLLFEKMFPLIYSRSHQRRWWEARAGGLVFAVAAVIVVSILSSKIATLWFGLLIVSGALVALLLHATATRRDDGI